MTAARVLQDRFCSKFTVAENDCWVWGAATDQLGYGQFWLKVGGAGRMHRAHRVAYELAVGPIPTGLVIDHLCRNRACVNPDHLEPVTQRENVRRGDGPRVAGERWTSKTHCVRGHEFTPENIRRRRNGGRSCRSCDAYFNQRRRIARVLEIDVEGGA